MYSCNCFINGSFAIRIDDSKYRNWLRSFLLQQEVVVKDSYTDRRIENSLDKRLPRTIIMRNNSDDLYDYTDDELSDDLRSVHLDNDYPVINLSDLFLMWK